MIASKINRLFSKIFAFLYMFQKISWINWIKLYDSNADNIVWVKINPLRHFLDYLKYNDLLSDAALIDAVVCRKMRYKIVVSTGIGKYSGKNIFYNISETCNPFNLANYSNSLRFVVSELENQGNTLYPKPNTVSLWENKALMQQKFVDLGISHPKTTLLRRNYTANDLKDITFPSLIKESHSAGSRGIHKVKNHEELVAAIEKVKAKGHADIIVQKLVNMRKDLRVTILGDKIILAYWRINPTKEWKPTATSFGNYTEFGNFPYQWESLFFENFRKLNIPAGAFDITWENDDLTTTPLVLEVSPSFQLNPLLPEEFKDLTYKQYKKKLFVKNAYHKRYIDVVFDLQTNMLNQHLKVATKREPEMSDLTIF